MDHYKIVWQKWIDPYIGHEEDYFPETNHEEESYEEESYDDEYILPENHIEDEYEEEEQFPAAQINKAISTPMGIIPINEYTASGKIFNFWIGHTNFDITNTIVEIIETIPGVETLDIFTRYRFRVGVGKIFQPAQVMSSINETIYKHMEK